MAFVLLINPPYTRYGGSAQMRDFWRRFRFYLSEYQNIA